MEINGRKFVEHKPLGGYSASLNTIPYHTTFVGKCNSCGRLDEIDHRKLRDAATYQSVLDAGKRLKCYACGKRNSELLTGYYAADK